MIYVVFILLAVLGGVGFGGYTYVTDLQERLEVVKENNVKLESALETSEASMNALMENMTKIAEANRQLRTNLQKAEEYGDELQAKLRRHDLTALAIKKPKLLEGKMNGATAKLWRELEQDTGGDGDTPLPHWLQSTPVGESDTGTGSEGGDENRASSDTDSPKTETSPTG